MPNDEEGEGIPPDPDPESAWESLAGLVKNTEHSAELAPLVDLLLPLRPVDRESVAQIIGPLIQSAEWPASWVKPRNDLVQSLEQIAPLVDVTAPVWAALQPDQPHRMLFSLANFVLRSAILLLSMPCPPRELRHVGMLCDLMLTVVTQANRYELTQTRAVVPPSIEAGRVALGRALFNYDEACRAMNNACGEILFGPLPLEP